MLSVHIDFYAFGAACAEGAGYAPIAPIAPSVRVRVRDVKMLSATKPFLFFLAY
jgi:hypothetical protein